MKFEWNEHKAADNLRRHGVDFVFATGAFKDPLAVEKIDDRQDYGEERIIRIGYATGEEFEKLLTIIYTEREDIHRLISARTADKNEQNEYFRENAA
jgi:uncharacterized protein